MLMDACKVALVFILYLCLIWNCKSQSYDNICSGAFDVYFVIDRSSSLMKGKVNHFKQEAVSFVSDLSQKFVNPLLRLSYITFSDDAKVVMPLTNDRIIVKQSLEELKTIVPNGPTLMNFGIKEVNKQIINARDKRASVIIILTDGKLEPKTMLQTINEARHARQLGATLLVVGISNYDKRQLLEIAGGVSKFVFQATDFGQLELIAKEVLYSSCVEVLAADPSTVCANESFSVAVTGRGFNRTGHASLVRCNFWQVNKELQLITPTEVKDNYLICTPVSTFTLLDGEQIIVQVSLNKGLSFISSNVTITAHTCNTATTGMWLVFLALLMLFLLWWFWKAICCIAAKDVDEEKDDGNEPIEPAHSVAPNTQWPAVDASYYGGSGAGGIKPVTVRWGDKGCTEAALHLQTPSFAQAVVKNTPNPKNAQISNSGHSSSTCGWIMSFIAGSCRPLVPIYERVSSMRPGKDEMRNCSIIRKSSKSDSKSKTVASAHYLDTAN